MKYQANPVIVDAFKIAAVLAVLPTASDPTASSPATLVLEDSSRVTPTPEMVSRMTPKPGDYWVIQSDGYIYLNPKDVFERKYHPFVEQAKPTVEELQKILDEEDPRPVRINDDGSVTVL